MTYKKKIAHAKVVAEELSNDVAQETVKSRLKGEGLFDRDIENVIASAHNIIGDNLKSLIREKLLKGENPHLSPELKQLDTDTLKKVTGQEIKAIQQGAKKL